MTDPTTGTLSASPPAVGALLRQWRSHRRRSQMDLALDAGVSTRHLSFIETGRASPSPEVVLALADGLDVPLRERNTLLLAAGYAPRYDETPLDAPAMARAKAAVQRVLDAHDPYPGVVLDRRWDVVAANAGALALIEGVAPELASPTLNVFRVSLHPDGLAARTRNFEEWGSYLLWQLEHQLALSGDAGLAALLEEVRGYPNVAALPTCMPDEDPMLVLTVDLVDPDLSLFTTLTTFGTPRDITLDELMIELFYPADDATAQHLGRAATTHGVDRN
ncbi:Transcriptional regulator, Cro/CI family [Euzebya pacifica]|uniref:Transcriptional regulator, Cro/CI family n=1 Tax=Euzebya pacifica TaxID=1608957 RepID=A0A346XSC9_9ACTN|nr:helix-turn-helix transcriptional regulator [Euzebya pacifica]AXV05126.1 Transcriptional regulator, Cro/CI family [Euzebya pacifica]